MKGFGGVSACFICCFVSFGVTLDDKPIQTFVVPHSHMDVGWVYTIQVGFYHNFKCNFLSSKLFQGEKKHVLHTIYTVP